ncbi:MAG TPA: hypothetical protein VK589_29945 [Chryseolinea sp.]|nr:hypothetical protein [Chryseolinea sp.]
MKIFLRGTRKHSKHQLHVSTWQTPTWFEKYFMFRRSRVVEYVGAGTKWFEMTVGKRTVLNFLPITDQVLISWLATVRLNDEKN